MNKIAVSLHAFCMKSPCCQRLIIFFVWRREVRQQNCGHKAQTTERKKIISDQSHKYWMLFLCYAVAWETMLFLSQRELRFHVGLVTTLFILSPIMVVVSFQESNNEPGQILSQFDDLEWISQLLWPEACLLPSILVFKDMYFFWWAAGPAWSQANKDTKRTNT